MTSLEQIQKVIDQEKEESFKNGLAQGYASAQRIYIWYSSNHKLVEPWSLEKLEEWSKTELNKIHTRLGWRPYDEI